MDYGKAVGALILFIPLLVPAMLLSNMLIPKGGFMIKAMLTCILAVSVSVFAVYFDRQIAGAGQPPNDDGAQECERQPSIHGC